MTCSGLTSEPCCEAILHAPGSVVEILGPLDAVKLRSCMTLFHRAAPAEAAFPAVLARFWDGLPDPVTDELLRSASAG